MTVRELLEQINIQVKYKPERLDLPVVIRTQELQMGYCARTETTGCGQGFDWNKGAFFIGTVDKLYKEDTLIGNPKWLQERLKNMSKEKV